jgi:hypothetical protein
VCVVNETFAKHFFGGANPLGHHVTDLYPTTVTTFEIVGVVGDVQEHSLRARIRPRFYGNYAHPIGTLTAPAIVLTPPATLLLSSSR